MTLVTLAQVLGKVHQLPSLSVVVTELLASFGHEEIESGYLVSKIEQDQGLAARVLRVANSAFYGLSSSVSAVNEAVVVLGFNTVRSLAMAAGIVKLFPSSTEDRLDRLAFWQHAIGTGICARVLAEHLGHDPRSAFSAGLLHDIGKLALHAYFPDVFNEILALAASRECVIDVAERSLLGYDHADIGHAVASQWNFPPEIREAIHNHHRPDMAPAITTDLVHVANSICSAMEIGNGGCDLVSPLSAKAWERLGVGWQNLGQCLARIERLNAGMNL